MAYTYEYQRPALTADVIIFRVSNGELQVLLIQRKHDPYKDFWAFPGGFMEIDETIEVCALRECYEETSIRLPFVFFTHIADSVDRDSRGRVISGFHVSFIVDYHVQIQACDDAKNIAWYSITQLPNLAFDHAEQLYKAIEICKNMHIVLNKRCLDASISIKEVSEFIRVVNQFQTYK